VKIPEMTVLIPLDGGPAIRLPWTVKEVIGPAYYNPAALAKLDIGPVLPKGALQIYAEDPNEKV
jgi:hypothetical protein